MTGAAGYALPGAERDRHFLGLDQLKDTDRRVLHRSLQSKLFESPAERRAVPVHRQVAEFLAAKYLAALIKNGLPVGRILALITGYDGAVVSEMRGLAAWLAAHSKPSRAEVIARDPLGTVLYGDAERFSPDEKRLLLDGIERQAAANPRFISAVQLDSRLGDLVSGDMENHIRAILTAPDRKDSWQSVVVVLLEALQHGEPLPKLGRLLIELIRDGRCWPRVRRRALDVFLGHAKSHESACSELKTLTSDVYAGKVPDPDDALLGCLLLTLYPATIPPSEIMRFLRFPRMPGNLLEYEYFWMCKLSERSTRDQLILLLDQFVDRCELLLADGRAHRHPVFFIRLLHFSLLERYLRASGENVDLARLFHWLEPAVKAGGWTNETDIGREEPQEILRWLDNRPSAWKTLLEMGLERCGERPDGAEPHWFNRYMREEEHGRLLGSARPRDFGLWCLDKAVAAKNRTAAEWLMGEVAECLHHGRFDEGLTHGRVLRRLTGFAHLNEAFDRRIVELEARTSDRDMSTPKKQAQARADRPDWHSQVKPHEDELREGSASPALLHRLAKAYFGGYVDVRGKSRRDRLRTLVARDEALVDTILCAFRKTVERDDLPSDRQIIRLGASNRTHNLALPFLAGMEEISSAVHSGKIEVDDRLLRLALAVHYTVPVRSAAQFPADSPPQWFIEFVHARPDTVAGVLIHSARAQLRSGAESVAGIHELADSPDHEGVARLASMSLLRQFPVRCASRQLSSLDRLLLAAMRHCHMDPLLELIDEKSADHRMSVAQRVHWLAAGLCISPESYVDRLDAFVTGRERRVRFLAEAAAGLFNRSAKMGFRRSAPALLLLIRLIGGSCRPNSRGAKSNEGVLVTAEMNIAGSVRSFVEQLARIADEDASRALAELSCDSDLGPWRSLLVDAAYRQNAIRREAEFACCGAAQALETLANGAPANAADLAALTVEHLNVIAKDIRDGAASGWRQYWNVDQYNRPQRPRPEDACRDSLLSALKVRLQPLGIEVQPEGRYANGRRSDLRICHDGYNVPVEIKRSCHRDVWSAIQSQLIDRYVRDPGTGGHGIYIVFWFGDTEDCRPTPPPTGLPPSDSRELGQRLLSALAAEEELKIQVCVFDVADPG